MEKMRRGGGCGWRKLLLVAASGGRRENVEVRGGKIKVGECGKEIRNEKKYGKEKKSRRKRLHWKKNAK